MLRSACTAKQVDRSARCGYTTSIASATVLVGSGTPRVVRYGWFPMRIGSLLSKALIGATSSRVARSSKRIKRLEPTRCPLRLPPHASASAQPTFTVNQCRFQWNAKTHSDISAMAFTTRQMIEYSVTTICLSLSLPCFPGPVHIRGHHTNRGTYFARPPTLASRPHPRERLELQGQCHPLQRAKGFQALDAN